MATNVERIFRTFVLSTLMMSLAACATATRGSTTLFIVETTPVGAKATTTVPTKEFGKMSKVKLNRIKKGQIEEPDFKYRFCEPTPCGIEMPRKTDFHVLVEKDGYTSEVHKIGYMHRKEIRNETARNTALTAGAVGIGTGVAVGATATSSILFSSGAAAGTAAGILVAAPVVLVGGIAMSVDAASGANYDVWPNPLPLDLQEIDKADPEWRDVNAVKAEFADMQRRGAMSVSLTRREAKNKRKKEIHDRRMREREQKALDKKEATEQRPES